MGLPHKLLIAGVLALFLFVFGWSRGASHVQTQYDAYRTAVEAAGRAQAAKTETITQAQSVVTAQSEKTYDQGTPALRNLYGPGRVRDSNTRRRPVSTVPDAAGIADAAPADAGSSAGSVAPDQAQCAGLESDAAVTTRQLLYLQDWVEQQGRVATQE